MLIPGFELVPALRELLHLLEQLDRALEDACKVQHGVRLERPVILREREAEELPHAAGQDHVQVASKRADRLFDCRRDRFDAFAMPLPRRLRRALFFLEFRRAEAARFPRCAVLRQKVAADAIDQHPEGRLAFGRGAVGRAAGSERAQVGREHRELRMAVRTFAKEQVESARYRRQRVAQPRRRLRARALGRQVPRTRLEESSKDIRRDEAAIEERREAVAQAALAKLDEHHRDVGIGPREMTADAERSIERFADESRNLRLIREVESGFDARLERELTNQRQAERVDRRDRNVAEPLAQLLPFCGRQL